jgi:hypothetical protein
MKDEVMTLNCGESCGIVLSRTYLVSIIIAIATCLVLYEYGAETHTHAPLVYKDTTWPDYLKDCG